MTYASVVSFYCRSLFHCCSIYITFSFLSSCHFSRFVVVFDSLIVPLSLYNIIINGGFLFKSYPLLWLHIIECLLIKVLVEIMVTCGLNKLLDIVMLMKIVY